ncbi:MAG: YkgJ family cysteine cluster protein [Candidatus Hodarchaeota archaeon]
MGISLSEFKFKCTKCGACCSSPGLIVNLTPRDLRSIRKFLKVEPEKLLQVVAFYQIDPNSNDMKSIQEKLVFPGLKTSKGEAYLGLLKRQDGRCIFLKENKCKIYSARPRLCQSYPYTFQKKGQGASIMITDFATKMCPGIGTGNNVNVAKVKELGKIVIADVDTFFSFARWWNSRKDDSSDLWSPRRLVTEMIKFSKP